MSNIAPGWYPHGPNAQRWWDGTQWTDAVQQPYTSSLTPGHAPEGTPPYTAQIWWIVGLFAIPLVISLLYLATMDWSGYMNSMMVTSSDASSVLAMYSSIFTPLYFVLLASSFLAYGATAALAYSDAKELLRRGVERPFPWALSFIPSYGSIVYVIGRSVVARRRIGRGLLPMGVYLTIFAVGMVLSIVISIVAMYSMVGSMGDLYSTYP